MITGTTITNVANTKRQSTRHKRFVKPTELFEAVRRAKDAGTHKFQSTHFGIISITLGSGMESGENWATKRTPSTTTSSRWSGESTA
eukprot:scaffold16987_cov73-Cyclotella_meneghiniana.AAC.5